MHPQKHDPSAHLLERARELKFAAKHEEALLILEEIVSHSPENIEALEEIADNELSLGHYDRAEKAAKSVLALDPQSCNAYYVLGFIASHGEHWNASIQALRSANALEPNNPEILRCLGWSLFSSGDAIIGIATLERALNLEPENPLVLCDLGVAYLAQRDFQKSHALLKRALELDPTNDRARECLTMVSRIASHETRE